MKYMLIMRTSPEALEAAKTADFEAIINAMGEFNEAMIAAGVLIGGDGLADASEGFVVDFAAATPVVTDGAFRDVEHRFNGFWILEVPSREAAIEWAGRAPLAAGDTLEVRRITDLSDFADFADNDHIKNEARYRDEHGL